MIIQQKVSKITAIFAGCLTPDHKVLMANLEYKTLGDLIIGDTLVSFDENPYEDGKRSRRYKTGTILNLKREFTRCLPSNS